MSALPVEVATALGLPDATVVDLVKAGGLAPVAPLPEHLTQRGSNPDLLRDELLDLIRKAIEHHPRSQQVALGPSEVGHPCARRLGYKLLGFDENPGEPNWKATVGTALHSWLEEVMSTDNPNQLGPDHTRWIIEATVSCGDINGMDLRGHCDLFDRVTGTVVDWKTCGPSMLKKYKNSGPGDTYRAQAHLYGRGWQRRGQHVERVAVMFLPRNGELREAVWWSEPYDEQVALDALARVSGIAQTTTMLGNQALALLPTADAYCSLCPFYKRASADLTAGCPGDARINQPVADSAVTEMSAEALLAGTTTPSA